MESAACAAMLCAPRLQLRVEALARGVLGERVEHAGIGGVAHQEQRGDRSRGEQHDQEGRARRI